MFNLIANREKKIDFEYLLPTLITVFQCNVFSSLKSTTLNNFTDFAKEKVFCPENKPQRDSKP